MTADEELGEVLLMESDDNGRLKLDDRGEPSMRWHVGAVHIEIGEP